MMVIRLAAKRVINFQPHANHFSGVHHGVAWLWPGLHLHAQCPDDGPHEGHVKAVDAELQEVHEEAEKVCQGISGGRSGKVQGGLAKEDLTEAGTLGAFLLYPICQKDRSEQQSVVHGRG